MKMLDNWTRDWSSKEDKISLKDTLDPYYSRHDKEDSGLGIVLMFIFAFCLGASVMYFHMSHKYKGWAPPNKPNCFSCHQKVMLTKYFERNKVLDPEKMAEAVLKTMSPRLMAAIAVGGEKKTPHTARNTGWKKQYSGAWQTHPRWGRVTSDVTEQALIAEFAMETHVADEKDLVRGLNAYGGEKDKKRGKYAFNVLRELEGM